MWGSRESTVDSSPARRRRFYWVGTGRAVEVVVNSGPRHRLSSRRVHCPVPWRHHHRRAQPLGRPPRPSRRRDCDLHRTLRHVTVHNQRFTRRHRNRFLHFSGTWHRNQLAVGLAGENVRGRATVGPRQLVRSDEFVKASQGLRARPEDFNLALRPRVQPPLRGFSRWASMVKWGSR